VRAGARAAVSLAAILVACAAPAPAPVVVELYQSQGCSSCPPANANVNALAARPGVLALSFGVTYWDHLGWNDGFASPEGTQRQRDYAQARGRERIWTPQVYVNGRADLIGNKRADLDAAVARARSAPRAGPMVSVSERAVDVAAGPAPKGAADVWMVRYDPQTVAVPIRAGENGGRTLPHRNVVHQLIRLGSWTGRAASYALPAAPRPGLRTAALVQLGRGGPIVAAATT
jgi:hypothetical protein